MVPDGDVGSELGDEVDHRLRLRLAGRAGAGVLAVAGHADRPPLVGEVAVEVDLRWRCGGPGRPGRRGSSTRPATARRRRARRARRSSSTIAVPASSSPWITPITSTRRPPGVPSRSAMIGAPEHGSSDLDARLPTGRAAGTGPARCPRPTARAGPAAAWSSWCVVLVVLVVVDVVVEVVLWSWARRRACARRGVDVVLVVVASATVLVGTTVVDAATGATASSSSLRTAGEGSGEQQRQQDSSARARRRWSHGSMMAWQTPGSGSYRALNLLRQCSQRRSLIVIHDR